ncbi:MAG: hypothetical protein U9N86_17310 [Bacteroidota bacterium]|nr:hypothetical protein [Bacteroidota bacterium]
MKDFEAFRKTCETNSSISETVIDEFILYYATGQYRLDRNMTKAFSAFRHVTNEFEQEWINRLKAQYLTHKIFQSGGLIRKVITHTELKRLNRTEMEFLEHQISHPWRFCFSIILDNPAPDFFLMEDILTGEPFTLFSPGITDTNKDQKTSLWFNLISFNGACWQSFGPIAAYKSFELDDIFFFATELDRRIESKEDIIRNIDKNPLPYMMLLSGANYPITMHKQDRVVQVYSEFSVSQVDNLAIKKSFTSEFSHDVYKFTLKRWGKHPHFAQFYFDENKKKVLLYASTNRGYLALVKALNQLGFNFSEEPDIRVNMSMLVTAKGILKKEITLNNYDHLFHVDTPPKDQEVLDNLNAFMRMILPDINAGRKPDIEKHAANAGVDIETARELVKTLFDKTGRR